jgi:hypothetical protein
MAKFGQNYDQIAFPRNSSTVTAGRNGMQFSGMIEDMMFSCATCVSFLDYVINLHNNEVN